MENCWRESQTEKKTATAAGIAWSRDAERSPMTAPAPSWKEPERVTYGESASLGTYTEPIRERVKLEKKTAAGDGTEQRLRAGHGLDIVWVYDDCKEPERVTHGKSGTTGTYREHAGETVRLEKKQQLR